MTAIDHQFVVRLWSICGLNGRSAEARTSP